MTSAVSFLPISSTSSAATSLSAAVAPGSAMSGNPPLPYNTIRILTPLYDASKYDASKALRPWFPLNHTLPPATSAGSVYTPPPALHKITAAAQMSQPQVAAGPAKGSLNAPLINKLKPHSTASAPVGTATSNGTAAAPTVGTTSLPPTASYYAIVANPQQQVGSSLYPDAQAFTHSQSSTCTACTQPCAPLSLAQPTAVSGPTTGDFFAQQLLLYYVTPKQASDPLVKRAAAIAGRIFNIAGSLQAGDYNTTQFDETFSQTSILYKLEIQKVSLSMASPYYMQQPSPFIFEANEVQRIVRLMIRVVKLIGDMRSGDSSTTRFTLQSYVPFQVSLSFDLVQNRPPLNS